MGGGYQHRTTRVGQILGGRDPCNPCGVDAYGRTVKYCRSAHRPTVRAYRSYVSVITRYAYSHAPLAQASVAVSRCRAIHPRGQSDDIITGSLGLCRINFHLCCIFIISRIMPHALRQSFCYEIFIDAARIACGAEQGLCNGRVSFRPSVCLVNRQQQRGAAGLRLSAGACSRHR